MESDGFWITYLSEASNPASLIGLHLAVFSEPYLSLVLDRRKTIKSRFSRLRCAAFREVSKGDVILIKEVAGPIRGIALARHAWYYDLAREPLEKIRDRYGDTICADDAFWDSRRDASYASLIELGEASAIAALDCSKRDRRGWVPLCPRQLPLGL